MRDTLSRRAFVSGAALGIAGLFLPHSRLLSLTGNVLLTDQDLSKIDSVITSFLCSYFGNLSAIGISNPADFHFNENDNTRMVVTMSDWNRQAFLSLGFSYENIETKVEYQNFFQISGNRVVVDVDFYMTFRYSDADPIKQKSKMRTEYCFELSRSRSSDWLIDSVQTSFDTFMRFQNMVEVVKNEGRQSKGGLNSNIIEEAKDRLLREDDAWFRSVASEPALTSAESALARGEANTYRLSQLPSRGLVYYNWVMAYYYAEWFATAPSSAWIFKDLSNSGGDCTNFTSQCIWAGFGGIVPAFDHLGYYIGPDTSAMKTLINTRKYMNDNGNLDTGWFGHGNGASNPWGNVDYFWNTASATVQPNGNPFMSSVLASLVGYGLILWIWEGDILQFRYSSTQGSSFNHSTFVDYSDYTGTLSGIYVSEHSPQFFSRKLTDKLLASGGASNVHLRNMKMENSDLTL